MITASGAYTSYWALRQVGSFGAPLVLARLALGVSTPRLRFHLGVSADDEGRKNNTLLGWDTAILFRRRTIPFERHETGALETLLHYSLEEAAYVRRIGDRSRYTLSDPFRQRDLEERVFPALLGGASPRGSRPPHRLGLESRGGRSESPSPGGCW